MPSPEEILEDFYQRLDGAIATFETAYPCFQCPVGCCECCTTVPFLVSLVEYRLLCEYARAHLSEERRAEIRQRAQEQAQRYRLSEVLRAERDPQTRERLPRLPCPFLEGWRCSIYPARPLACRLFGRTIFTEGEDAGRFNGCTILLKQAEAAGQTGKTVPMYSADRLRAQLNRLNQLIHQAGGLVGMNTLVKFVAELGFEWGEEEVRQGHHVLFLPGGGFLLPEGD